MSPARVTVAVALLVVVAADGAIITATGALPVPVAWAVASTMAGLLMGVALMVPAVDEAARDARTFLSFERRDEPEPAVRPAAVFPGPDPSSRPAEPRTAALSAIAGRREAAAAIRAGRDRDGVERERQAERDMARERQRVVGLPCDPAACCETGWACDVHAPLHDGRAPVRWARPTFDDLGAP